jgi:uncharacterized protein YdbL (DUF1318 family)
MKKILNIAATFLLLVLLIPTAYAVTLQEAKEQGLVGEQRDGYVCMVVNTAPADVAALIRDINGQRRQRYQQIARQNNISVEQVGALAYERAVAATRSGHYIQNASGSWQRK